MTKWVAPSPENPRRITILGSTGSVGQSTVDLIARDPASYRVEALVALRSVDLLAEQARGVVGGGRAGGMRGNGGEVVVVGVPRLPFPDYAAAPSFP